MRHELAIDDPDVHRRVARLIREARTLIGWSQRELAGRARLSQARISRFESGVVDDLDVAALARVLAALGLRGQLMVEDRHLDDRRRQRDLVHAALVSRLARYLRRLGWLVATEVQIGAGSPRGWIDLLERRPADASGLMCEIKGDLPDIGGLQRQVRFYTSAANEAMRTLGWGPARITSLVLAADTASVHASIRGNAPLIRELLPGSPDQLTEWLADPGRPVPPPTLALADPLPGRRVLLRRTPLQGRRSPAAYRGYADAAEALGRRRR
jgi:transcriptional regulator with XRE-family HTH domain